MLSPGAIGYSPHERKNVDFEQKDNDVQRSKITQRKVTLLPILEYLGITLIIHSWYDDQARHVCIGVLHRANQLIK